MFQRARAILVSPIRRTAPATPHPLGPLLYRYSPVDRGSTRRRAICVAVVCATLLGLAVWLTPSERGLGTHTQLGLIGCSWPTTLGIPCPTCGMTTAFAWMVRGRLLAAFAAQPAGAALCLVVMLVLVLAVREAISLRAVRINWYRVRPLWAALGVVALASAAWGYKILAFRAMLR